MRETAPFYRLSRGRVDAIVDDPRGAAEGWPQAAQALRIRATEIEMMAAALGR